MSFHDTLIDLLKTQPKFVDLENDLLQSAVIDAAYKIDPDLIMLLISNAEIKAKFFSEIAEHWVFDINTFVDYVSDKNFLNDSYTKFKNKIGLTIDGKSLRERWEVALVRPYKDCILEWGMTKEDQKRKEIFFNQVLAQDEIDKLLEPKVLTNRKRYTVDGEQAVGEIKRNEEWTIRENLIIKGNNLLALHSLKKEFAGKIKLIYIDPPYNTWNDGFKYNDRFNHSTWLTFMKNRLEAARELLMDDGIIFVQCDDNEQAYLKVLMDEIFPWNFLNTISVKAKVSAWASGGGEDKRIKKNIEYIHCYYKNSFVVFNDTFKNTEIETYIESMKKDEKSFKYTQILISTWEKKYIKTIQDWGGEDIVIYKHNNIITKTINQVMKEENISIRQAYKKYFDKIFTTTNAQSSIRQRVRDAVWNDNIFYSIEYTPKSWRDKGRLTTQYYTGNKKVLLVWFSNTAFIDEKGNVIKKEKYGTFWDGIDYNNLNKEWNTVFPYGKKPEQLLKRVLDMSTSKKDIVLDYHLWSWTTAAVCHKMWRQYIGIEQMDYKENDTVIRLQNVINGDQSWISQSVNRQWWGEFIYCELAKHNENFIDHIQEAQDTQALLAIREDMKTKSFLDRNVDLIEQEEAMQEWMQLSLDEQKTALVWLLNKNQLYINLSDIDDQDFTVGEDDKEMNRKFYQL